MWLAGAVALAIFAPNLIWQMQHHWPTLEDLANVRRTHKNVELPPLAFLGEQVLMMGPVNLLIWAPGIWVLFRRKRFLGFAYPVLLAAMMALHAKDYYVAPMYPMLFAAGGVFWETITEARGHWVRVALPPIVAVLSLPLLPVALRSSRPTVFRSTKLSLVYTLRARRLEKVRSPSISAMSSAGRRWCRR